MSDRFELEMKDAKDDHCIKANKLCDPFFTASEINFNFTNLKPGAISDPLSNLRT